ncbi:GGDEF/EAL domain-containing response regulator [Sphaerotilus hippei]|nr:EAL domain-containing protein [Sphaerotilus hippei]
MNLPTNRRILLIDDMPSIHEDFRKLLAVSSDAMDLLDDEALLFGDSAAAEQIEFELDSAYQGQEGLSRVQQALQQGRPYAMAFVDMRMPPGWDGVETIERLWQADPRLQVVICTAYTDHAWEDVLRRLDARDRLLVLKKPFDTIEVLQLARTLVMKWSLSLQAQSQMDGLEAAVRQRTRELSDEVQARRQAELALRVRDRAIEAAVNAIMITDHLRADQPIEYVNPAFERITGYPPQEVLGRNARFLQGDESEQPALREIAAAVREEREGHGVFRNRRKDGSAFWNELHIAPVRDAEGAVTHFVGVLNDVTAARDHQQALEFQARHDALTGLPNRLMLRDRLDQAIAHARRMQERVGVLWLDLDHFKFVNDSYGHPVGDGLLVALSTRLRETMRRSDTVARLGGDEFVVLLPGIHRACDASAAAQKVLDALAPPFEIDGHLLHASTSVGVSLFPEDGDSSEALLMHADTAMYRAKHDGRNGFQFYSREMSEQARERETLARALHTAVDENQFELHYQPKLDLGSGRVTGVEALIRWRHPALGMVPPSSFIPIAEETGLIVDIGDWVLRTACAQAQAWQQRWQLGLSVAVNVSPRQFRQHDLPATVRRVLDDSGLAGGLLELELTESLLMHQTDAVIETLRSIKSMGVSLALDDFGTGFSSLSYLRRFPLDLIKIDRAFVAGLASIEADEAITRAIIGMAHALGMAVVAEGVETPEQLAFLQAHRCDAAQGYLLGRPMAAAALDALWQAQRNRLDTPPAH